MPLGTLLWIGAPKGSAWAQKLSPDGCVLLATLGFALVLLELNRPGLIVAGASGLLLLLLAVAGLLHYPLERDAVALLVLAVLTLAANLWFEVAHWALTIATVGLCAGLQHLVSPGSPVTVHTPVAATCGITSGAATAFLSRVALRARRAKQVN